MDRREEYEGRMEEKGRDERRRWVKGIGSRVGGKEGEE